MQVKKSPQHIPVRYIKGVGPKKSESFRKLGVETVLDLFYYLPRRYEDRSRVVPVKDAVIGESMAVAGRVLKTNFFRARTGTSIFEVVLGDDKNRLFAVWYNLPFMNKVFKKGQTVVFYGKVDMQKRLQMNHPAYEVVEQGKIKGALDVGRIVPIYPLTASISQRYMRKVVHNAIKAHIAHIDDPLPTSLRARRKLVDFKFAVENIHFPYSFENLERAYHRLVFEEFFILQVVMALRRLKNRKKGIKYDLMEGLREKFEELFDFELTSEQKKCIKDIERDMASDKPMNRLLQGDVGSGKTAVAMYALLLAVNNGYQAAMMAPTEILARQHYVTVSKTLMPLGINVRLLVSGIEAEASGRIRKEVSSGEADIVIGTHSLIQEGMDFDSLGLAVIDEQHKFGVAQRKSLIGKGPNPPDTLVMTATPIPRSLALTVYGDMDISLLKQKPGGRQPVTTYWVGEEKRRAIYDFIRSEIDAGHQAFIVYPRVKRSGSSQMLSAEEMWEHFKEEVFPDLEVGMVHGRMKADEKKRAMERFRKGEQDILVATTVIEVGVDVPNVTVMLVEHAERYGLAQLHQLRGRIGRGEHQSYCILLGDPKTDSSRERLAMMSETDDGFKIAEKDLDIRGPGEFLGKRQSGLPELRFGNIVRDFDIMEEARTEAFDLVEQDPALSDPHNRRIREDIAERFGGKTVK
ncbi:MAG: ATP-dependent DNA helicase RecG [Candidatus Omnitrophica bacterium]|nr:ATP-dependent DNA helicase RecG [Candidatus Omnitrophota bacterium]